MKLTYFLLLSIIISCSDQTEIELETLGNDVIFTIVDNPPTYPDGMNAYIEYVQANLEYPAKARRNSVEGKVFVEFIVTKTGTIESAYILKSLEENCDKAALEIIKNSPDWYPGTQKGVPVNVKMVLPITFKLN
jgi:TonB family protein